MPSNHVIHVFILQKKSAVINIAILDKVQRHQKAQICQQNKCFKYFHIEQAIGSGEVEIIFQTEEEGSQAVLA
jgi:hypothetical protein